jgi:DNA invertase Pin-like site-specific DNA recombinase
MTPAPLSIGLVGYYCVAAGIFRVHRAHIFPVVCSSLARLCSYFGKRGAGFKSLKDSWADTTTPHGRLMLTVLGGLAEFERELIRARTGEGRIRAKARGVKFGRPRKMTPHQRQEALQRLHAGETMADVARTYAVDAATISWRLPALSSTARPAPCSEGPPLLAPPAIFGGREKPPPSGGRG